MKTMSPKTEQRTRWWRGPRVWLGAGAAIAVVVLAVFAIATLIDSDEPVVGPRAVVEEFIDLRSSGQAALSLDLATAEVVEDSQFAGGLEVWNLRGELTEPCEETASGFRCVLSEQNDFHAAAGLGPWTATLRLTVNEAGLISATGVSVAEWESTIRPFNARFMAWFGLAHPEVAAQMSGAPMSNTFNPEDARLALEHVDEFVAQSDDYPINP